MRTSVMLPRFTARAAAVAVISATSPGCSAMMGRPPAARIRLAQSLMEMGFVMQWMRSRRLRRASSSAPRD